MWQNSFHYDWNKTDLCNVVVDCGVCSPDEHLLFDLRQVLQENFEHITDLRCKLAGRAQDQGTDVVLLQLNFLNFKNQEWNIIDVEQI